MAGAYKGLNVRRSDSLAVMTSEASLKSGCHGDHQEMFSCVCEGQQCWNPEHGDGNSFGQEGAPLSLGEGGRRQGRGHVGLNGAWKRSV